MNYRILKKDGSVIELRKWQYEVYPALTASNKVSPHLSIKELSFQNEFEMSELTIDVFEIIREKWGNPLAINAAWRTKEHQADLRKRGYRAAMISPHEYGYALDLDTTSPAETMQLLKVIRAVKNYYCPFIRIGWEDYLKDGNTFIHFDIAPFYHRPEGIFYDTKKYPVQWQTAGEW